MLSRGLRNNKSLIVYLYVNLNKYSWYLIPRYQLDKFRTQWTYEPLFYLKARSLVVRVCYDALYYKLRKRIGATLLFFILSFNLGNFNIILGNSYFDFGNIIDILKENK
jgi:hypothetical protein